MKVLTKKMTSVRIGAKTSIATLAMMLALGIAAPSVTGFRLNN